MIPGAMTSLSATPPEGLGILLQQFIKFRKSCMRKLLLVLAAAACMAGPPASGQQLQNSPEPPVRGGVQGQSIKAPVTQYAGKFAPQERKVAGAGGIAVVNRMPDIRRATPRATSTAMPEIYGNVVYADDWTNAEASRGMYRIGTSDDVPFERIGTAKMNATSGGVVIGDSYYACYFMELYGMVMTYVQKFFTEDWTEDREWNFYSETSLISTGVVYDKETKKVYGCFRNDANNGYVFGTADYAAKKRQAIKPLARAWSAVAIDGKGQIYAIDDQGKLYSVNKKNGSMTLIGNTGLVASHPSSACIDPRTGRCFYALTNSPDGSLYEIDLSTAESTLLYHFPQNQEVVGMYIPVPDADADAPGAVTDLTLDFPEGNLSGTVSFTCPETTVGGEPGSGNITYVIVAGETTVAQGTAAYGSKVSAEVTLTKGGAYTFTVYASNAFGDGLKTKAEVFVGFDIPETPQLSAAIDNGVVTLEWPAVTSSVNGGYIDRDNLTYNVTRRPDGKVIARDIRQTKVTDTPPSDGVLTGYSYAVTATSGNVTSVEAVSPVFWLGAVTPPYNITFDDPETVGSYTVVDANADNSTWIWSENESAYRSQQGLFGANDADDWLVTPAVRLQKGKMYQFTAALRAYFGNPATVEIRCGKAPLPEAMGEVVLETTRITDRAATDYTGYIIPDEDGTYYVGIHAVTPASDGWPLYVEGVAINAGVEAVIPDVVTGMSVTPAPDGSGSAHIRLTAPSKAVNGTELTSLLRLDILRDGEAVTSFKTPAPGAVLEYTDEAVMDGYHKYEALAYNASGAGKKTGVTVYVGVNEPARPSALHIEEISTGVVRLSWEPVTTDKDGKPMNPDLVTYTILTSDQNGEAVTVAEGITGNSYDIEVEGAQEKQFWAYYALRAVTEGGYSLRVDSPVIPVGKPYASPYAESFGNSSETTMMRSENRDGMWGIYDDASGIPAHDGDNGYVAMFGETYGADGTLFSGKVSLAGLSAPALTFYAYNIAGADEDLNEIEVGISTGSGKFTPVRKAVMSELGAEDGWYAVMIPLSDYAGKEIQFSLRGVTRTRKFTLVDDIRIADVHAHNIAVESLTVPAKVLPDNEFGIVVKVRNNGLSDAGAHRVTLFRNGEAVQTEEAASLASGVTSVITFKETLNATHPENTVYHAVAEYDADMDLSDNTSARQTVTVRFPAHPTVTGLEGRRNNAGVALAWQAPDLTSASAGVVTDDFEDYTPWAHEGLGNWTLVDVDGAGVGHIGNVELPGIYNSRLAYFVMDASFGGLGELMGAYSGNKYLSTMFCLPTPDGTLIQNDDWLISPLLSGTAQTIGFMARSANVSEGEESFEVWLATSDSTDPADFVKLEAVESVPGTWMEYTYELPAGTVRFAIRYNKTYGFMLHIDDVTFTPAGQSSLAIEGYNVYRDGKRINEAPVKETSYVDATAPAEGVVSYAVSVSYGADGESRACDPVKVDISGVEAVSDDEAAVAISAGGGCVVIEGAEGMPVVICDVSGRVVFSGEGTASMRVPVGDGIYLATAGATTVKVAVK